jgi:hypothetical protein
MQQPAARLRAAIALLVLTAQLASCVVPALAAAQGSSTSNVQKGQEYYEQSRFDEAISLLKDLVDRGVLAGEDLQHARELLARSYVKKGYPVQGKEMFKGILRTTPTWRPDPIRVPPDETAVFEQALKEYTQEAAGGGGPATPTPGSGTPTPETTPPAPPASQPKPQPTPASELVPSAAKPEKSGGGSNKKVWYIAGGGVLLAGVAALALGGGSSKNETPAKKPLANFPDPPTP